MVASDFGDNGSGGNFFDEKIGFLEQGDVFVERCVFEKVDRAVDDDFLEGGLGGENRLDGAATGELESVAEAVTVDLTGFDPAETGGSGLLEDEGIELFTFFGSEFLRIGELLPAFWVRIENGRAYD